MFLITFFFYIESKTEMLFFFLQSLKTFASLPNQFLSK